MKQVVAFLFIKKNKVMLQYIKNDIDKVDSPSVPRGNILAEDKDLLFTSEMEHTLHRLVYIFSKGTLIPLQYELVRVLNDNDRDELIYLYFIYSWDGSEPSVFSLDKTHIGRLRFVQIDDALSGVTGETDKKILTTAKETI